MNSWQKWGGVAALGHAAAYMVGMVLGVALIFPLLSADTDQYLKFVADNQTLLYLWNFISYWVSAITLVVMALALYERLKSDSPALPQVSTVFGLIWAGLIIASANLMLRNLGVVAALYAKDPVQAQTAWVSLQAVENGIVSGNELVGSLWVLLLSVAALKSNNLTKALNYLGVVISVAGILTIIPGLAETMIMIFGPGMIVWSVWVGIILLRHSSNVTPQKPIALAAR